MYNILTDDLPKIVVVDGVDYAIRWWFRAMIAIEMVLQDEELDMTARRAAALTIFYPVIPPNILEAERQLLAFYGPGKPRNRKQMAEAERNRDKPAIYSYEYDDEYIYAAFRQQYNINLNTVEGMHWFEFRALLNALGNCMFTMIKGYRATDLSKIKDKDARKFYEEQKEFWELPNLLCDQAVVDELEDALMNGGDLTAFKERRRANG